MPNQQGWKETDPTADVGIEVWAGDWESLVATSCRALTSLLVLNPDKILDYMSESIFIRTSGRTDQLHDLLSELVFRFERGMVFADFEVLSSTADALAVLCKGEDFDPARHGANNEIKAVTWHLFSIQETHEGGLIARIIFDV